MHIRLISGRVLRRIIPLVCLAALLTACDRPEPPQILHGTWLPSPKPVADFQLTDHKGQPFTLASLQGHWTFAFFGYTQCPDVCPTSLSMLAQVMRRLEDNPQVKTLPRGLFVSVDPERDTPELIARFVPYFHADFIGATGEQDELMKLTRQLGILYQKAAGDSDDNYLVDHSAAVILFDPDGHFHALFNVPHDPDKIAAEYILLSDYYEATR